MQDLVSIIVPVYNVAQYLDRCLTSLAEQTYKNIETILVDDGSTDPSGALCDAWQSRDARNYGLQRASGEFVCFIDSDDWLDLRFTEAMLKALVETESDIAECDYLHTEDSKPTPSPNQAVYDCEVFEGKECFRRFLTNHFFVSVCNKLYRKSVLENQLFRKGAYHEDEFWTYKIFSKAKKVCRLHYTGYFYFQRHGSIIHSNPSQKKITDAFVAGKERIDFIELQYPEFASIGYSKMMYSCMYLFNEARRSDIPQKLALQEELAAYFHIMFVKYLKSRQYQKEMWRFFLFFFFPNRYCKWNY